MTTLKSTMRLEHIATPALVLDLDRAERNCAAMIQRAKKHGVALRPHLKTAKSADIARLATRGQGGGITVSTLAEVDYFAQHGFRDITYAVGIAEGKLDALVKLQRLHGLTLTLLADHPNTVLALARRAEDLGAEFALLIEIDCGGGRGGVLPDGQELLSLARAVHASPALHLAGVLTHAGHSYKEPGADAIAAVAETERAAAVLAATRLREAGFAVQVVSVGSTPTAVHARNMEGVTEMRPGVYTLFDLDQVALGSCSLADIAASVLATVIGHNPRSQRVLIDAGALALSKDLSANEFGTDFGYGLVCPIHGGVPIDGLRVAEVHQEHGFIAGRGSCEELFAQLPIGARVRILPHHACMTVAPYSHFNVVRAGSTEVIARCHKATGWHKHTGHSECASNMDDSEAAYSGL
ncbi:alanine racemase [Undibacterium sp.]|jgi:D-serine deaminase-like pyridoxal phosphate-dependent protein|uniref:alanine racemase n=1 Tax=Undibacterium sp. TaxID=1914977 RepID=UPI002C9514D0|nr:alanine racemase [Undibacterium sp.]HTD05671.1 alanine racemase [Undibacterium sp.]